MPQHTTTNVVGTTTMPKISNPFHSNPTCVYKPYYLCDIGKLVAIKLDEMKGDHGYFKYLTTYVIILRVLYPWERLNGKLN